MLPLSPQRDLRNANWPFFGTKVYFSRRKCTARFLSVKTYSGKVVRHGLSVIGCVATARHIGTHLQPCVPTCVQAVKPFGYIDKQSPHHVVLALAFPLASVVCCILLARDAIVLPCPMLRAVLSSELQPLVGCLFFSTAALLHAYSTVRHSDFNNIDCAR